MIPVFWRFWHNVEWSLRVFLGISLLYLYIYTLKNNSNSNSPVSLCSHVHLPFQWARAALRRVEMRTCQPLLCRTRPLSTHPLASLSLSKESNTTKSRRERRAQRKRALPLKPRKLRYNNKYMHNICRQKRRMWKVSNWLSELSHPLCSHYRLTERVLENPWGWRYGLKYAVLSNDPLVYLLWKYCMWYVQYRQCHLDGDQLWSVRTYMWVFNCEQCNNLQSCAFSFSTINCQRLKSSSSSICYPIKLKSNTPSDCCRTLRLRPVFWMRTQQKDGRHEFGSGPTSMRKLWLTSTALMYKPSSNTTVPMATPPQTHLLLPWTPLTEQNWLATTLCWAHKCRYRWVFMDRLNLKTLSSHKYHK